MRARFLKGLTTVTASLPLLITAGLANAQTFQSELPLGSIAPGMAMESNVVSIEAPNGEYDVAVGVGSSATLQSGALLAKLSRQGQVVSATYMDDGLSLGTGLARATNGDLFMTGVGKYDMNHGGPSNDYVLVRLSPQHNALWAFSYDIGNGAEGEPNGVLGTRDNGAIIYGDYVLKVNAAGDVEWSFSLPNQGSVTSVKQTATRLQQSPIYVVTGTMVVNGSDAAFIMRIDSSGHVLWANTYDDPTAEDRLASIIETHDHRFVGFGVNAELGTPHVGCEILEVDLSGNIVFANRLTTYYPDDEQMGCTAGIEDANGDLIATGYHGPPGALQRNLLARAPDGYPLWEMLYGDNESYSLQQTQDGGYSFAGRSPQGISMTKTDFVGAACGAYGGHETAPIDGLIVAPFTVSPVVFVQTAANVQTTSQAISETMTCANICADADTDGVCDAADNCPTTYNPSQTDIDGDDNGDACVPACIFVQEGLSPLGHTSDTMIGAGWVAVGTPGTGVSISTGKLPNSYTSETRALIRYDLGFLPPSTTVLSATVQIHALKTTIYATTVDVLQVTSPWVDTSVTWNTAPSTAPAPLLSYPMVPSYHGAITLSDPNLMNVVQSWINNPALNNNGIMLRSQYVDGAYQNYAASEYPISYPGDPRRPRLDLCVTIPN